MLYPFAALSAGIRYFLVDTDTFVALLLQRSHQAAIRHPPQLLPRLRFHRTLLLRQTHNPQEQQQLSHHGLATRGRRGVEQVLSALGNAREGQAPGLPRVEVVDAQVAAEVAPESGVQAPASEDLFDGCRRRRWWWWW